MPTFIRHKPKIRSRRRQFIFSSGAAATYTIEVSGGYTFGGEALLAVTKVIVPTGGITLAGEGLESASYIPPVPTGGYVFAGAGTATYTFAWLPTGGYVFDGTAPFNKVYQFIPTGGIELAGEATMTAMLVTPTVTTVEGKTRNDIFKRFLRETGLGVYGVVTGIGGGATVSFDDTTRLRSSQFNINDWIGAWARISKNASGVSSAPENETFAVTNYDPTTNGRITAGTYSGSIAVADEYELWRFPHPKTVIDDLDVCLQEDIFLPCWTVLSEIPDFDMEQTGTSDWSEINGTMSKVSTGNPYLTGKRYLALSGAVAGTVRVRSANEIKVEPGKRYHLSAVGLAADDNNTLALSAYDVTNSTVIQSTTWDRQYPGRMVVEFTTPSTCHAVKVEFTHTSTDDNNLSYWDEVCFYPMDSYDISLPWWVKNKSQVKAIFDMDMEQVGDKVYDPVLRGVNRNLYDIRDDAFGSGQLKIVARNGGLRGPIFIFGVRNETAYSNDNADTKRIDANLIIACLAVKVFKRLKTFPNSNAMQTNWVVQQYNEWENTYKRLFRQQGERIEEILQTIPPSGQYLDSRFTSYN
jgi:hypothetical protein